MVTASRTGSVTYPVPAAVAAGLLAAAAGYLSTRAARHTY
jgi:hypothetical protein